MELRGQGNLAPVGESTQAHLAQDLLWHLSTKGAPIITSLPPWKLDALEQRLKRGAHQSRDAGLGFLQEEMLSFVERGFWMVPPFSELKKKLKGGMRHLRGLRLPPTGATPQ